MQLKNKNHKSQVFQIALIVSLLLHIMLGVIVYNLIYKIKIIKKEDKKIALNFKKGGDTKSDTSKEDINSYITQNFIQKLQDKLDKESQAAPATTMNSSDPIISTIPRTKTNQQQNANKIPNSNIKTQNQEAKSLSQISKIPQNNLDSTNKQDSTNENSLNLSSLQIYNQRTINPYQTNDMNYKQALNYVLSKNIPKENREKIIELYGRELGDYGMAELDYIINNLSEIGRITQYHINRRGYPELARILKKDGKNVVSFNLYPNGDISDLTIESSSNSLILDNDIQTTIKIAFKDYPRPSTKVKIRIYMTYRLIR